MEKVFCIGFPKTGTTSIEKALGLLGYNVCDGHFSNNRSNYLIALYINEDFAEIDRLIEYYDAFADLPWGGTNFYLYLSKKYPNAKFIHSERDPQKWYTSLEKMLTKLDQNPDTAMDTFHRKGRYGAVYYLQNEFKVDKLVNNKDTFISHYQNLNMEIRKYFDSNEFAYLNMNITMGDGWEKLCPFLEKEIPKLPFPKENTGIEPGHRANQQTANKNRLRSILYRIFNG